jgi:hypothetical protein
MEVAVGDRTDKIVVCIAGILGLVGNAYYCWQALAGAITPTLATWVILEIGTGLSLATYLRYNKGKHQFISNVANFFDPIVVFVVAVVVALSPQVDTQFRFWNFVCLCLAVLSVVVWAVTHSAFQANIVSQSVMSVGYVPTILGLIREQRNGESFVLWTAGMVVALLLLVPPIRHRNWLGMLYIGRGAACVAVLLGFMLYYHFFGLR